MPKGTGFYQAAEKHLKIEIHQGRLGKDFSTLVPVAEQFFLANIGSNAFHELLETHLLSTYPIRENMNDIVNLHKSLVEYRYKSPALIDRLWASVD